MNRKTLRIGKLTGLMLVLTAFAALVRQFSLTQIELGPGRFVSLQFVLLAVMGVLSLFRVLWGGGSPVPFALVLSGPVFFVYAAAVDAIRAPEHAGALLIDSLHVLLPVVIAAGILTRRSSAERKEILRWFVLLLTGVCAVYMVVATLVHTLDWGDFVAPRYRGHENLPFSRLSGPLGGATSLFIVFIPGAVAAWQAGYDTRRRRWLWRLVAAVLLFGTLWTVSRLGVAVLALFVLFTLRWRRFVALAYALVLTSIGLDTGALQPPEKWVRYGMGDPGRVMARETCLQAWRSSEESLVFGVGSHRLNVLTATASGVARGERRFEVWRTEFGSMPYGPHSVLWWSLSSYGLAGALLRCAFLAVLWFHFLVRSARRLTSGAPLPRFAVAVALTSLGFLFDDSHLVYPYLMAIWALFYAKAIEEFRSPAEAGAPVVTPTRLGRWPAGHTGIPTGRVPRLAGFPAGQNR